MIVVTGGAGFIGSNLLAALEKRDSGKAGGGASGRGGAGGDGGLVVSDRLRSGDKWRNLAKRELSDLVHPDDLFPFLDGARSGIRAVLHMGAISSTTETDADLVIENNFRLSLRLWRWCASAGVPFIYASSAATYGDGAHGFEDGFSAEALARLRPLNPYGWSKHLFDRKVRRMLEDGEPAPPQWAGLKFFNVYGPNEYHKGSMRSVVVQAFEQARASGSVTLFRSHHPDYEDGGQLRDFVSVHDCVAIVLWLLDHPEISGLFNAGTGTARSFRDLALAVFRAMGLEPRIEYVDTPEEIRDRYQYFTEADMTRLRSVGYERPALSLEEGVQDYVENYLATEDRYR